MNTAKINCPCCHSSGQAIILDDDFGGGWVNCTECGKKMHISGAFAKESPEMIAKTKWHWASGDMDIYAQCMRDIAKEQNLLLADVTALWQQELDNGKTPESLLHNNINHPNDYGHSIYAKAKRFPDISA